VLISGNHRLIEEWRTKESLRRTYERRPDLLENIELTDLQKKWLLELQKQPD
jgi:tRNA (guanine37-N1)-methyltransferase